MKKTISIFMMLVLLLGVSLSAGAKEETKIDTEELRSVLTLNMYQAEKVTAQNYLDFPMSGVFFGPKDILFREVIGLGIITGKEPVVSVDDLDPKKYPHAPRFTADLVRDVFESVIGGYGTFDYFFRNTKQIADNRGRILIQEPDGGYVYLVADAGSGGDPGGVTYTALIDTEIVGDTVYLYEVFGEYDEDGDRFTLFGTFSRDSKIKTGQIASGLRGDGEVGKNLLDGSYDEYLPVYKHTYKANKYGGYYWESTERVSPAKAIPLSMLPAGSVSNPSTSDGAPVGFAVAALACFAALGMVLIRKRKI